MLSHLRSPTNHSSQSIQVPDRHSISANDQYSEDVLRHSEEQQSIYRDTGGSGMAEYELEEYNHSNPRKRPHTDGQENPKKRAAVAVSRHPPTALLRSIKHV